MDDLRDHPVPFNTWPGRYQRPRFLYQRVAPARPLHAAPMAPRLRLLARLHHLLSTLLHP